MVNFLCCLEDSSQWLAHIECMSVAKLGSLLNILVKCGSGCVRADDMIWTIIPCRLRGVVEICVGRCCGY